MNEDIQPGDQVKVTYRGKPLRGTWIYVDTNLGVVTLRRQEKASPRYFDAADINLKKR